MPRLVRRAPLSERIAAQLNPWDFLLWLSEEMNGYDWVELEQGYATTIGIALNAVFTIAKANAKPGKRNNDDVFADSRSSGSGWLRWLMHTLVFVLTIFSVVNAFYTFLRKRRYRLFEQSIDVAPSTPSAQRVPVEPSFSNSASPLRLLNTLLNSNSAASRAHPDAARDVWELAVWDPNPLSLSLFCSFSPGHILVYYFFLPLAPHDPSSKTGKLATMLALILIISFQLHVLYKSVIRQTKDNALIHREVLHEYDTKFVRPALQTPVRDVGLQFPPPKRRASGRGLITEVDTYNPTTLVNRGWKTNPNPSYAASYDPLDLRHEPEPRVARRQSMTPQLSTTNTGAGGYFPSVSTTGTSTQADFSSPIRPKQPPMQRQPVFRRSDVGGGDGGSMGVFTHAASPLRKAASSNQLRDRGDRGRDGSPAKREGSPLKKVSSMAFGERDREKERREERGYGGLGVGRRESGRW